MYKAGGKLFTFKITDLAFDLVFSSNTFPSTLMTLKISDPLCSYWTNKFWETGFGEISNLKISSKFLLESTSSINPSQLLSKLSIISIASGLISKFVSSQSSLFVT
mgnify:CR=1 FL=1